MYKSRHMGPPCLPQSRPHLTHLSKWQKVQLLKHNVQPNNAQYPTCIQYINTRFPLCNDDRFDGVTSFYKYLCKISNVVFSYFVFTLYLFSSITYLFYVFCCLCFFFHIYLKIHQVKRCRRRLAGSGECFPFLYLWWFDYIFLQDLQKGIQKKQKGRVLSKAFWVFVKGFSSVAADFVAHFWGMNILTKLKKNKISRDFNLFVLIISYFSLILWHSFITPYVSFYIDSSNLTKISVLKLEV